MSSMHIMQECLFPTMVIIGMSKHSPYTDRLVVMLVVLRKCLFPTMVIIGMSKHSPYTDRLVIMWECLSPPTMVIIGMSMHSPTLTGWWSRKGLKTIHEFLEKI